MTGYMEGYQQVIVDGPFLTRRAYEANGLQALLGASLGTLIGLMRTYEPVDLYVAWEPMVTATPAREVIWEDYKRDRKRASDEYYDGLRMLQDEILPHLGILQAWPALQDMGRGEAPVVGEADDVAATLVRQDMVFTSLLWSADKDWLQLVGGAEGSEVCHLLRPAVGKSEAVLVTPQNIRTTTGLTADEWTHVLALAGDRTDWIPGLPQVGRQRAEQLLRACPDIVALAIAGDEDTIVRQIASADPSMGRWGQVAIDHGDLLAASLELVRLRTVPIDVRYPEPDLDLAQAWCDAHQIDLPWDTVAGLLGPSDDEQL